ncbi:MAG TPA: uracil-DNA glycosylase [Candidatus Obscuribacterales bacterium]
MRLGDSSGPTTQESPPLIEGFTSLEHAKELALRCQKCGLCSARTNVVFSDGNPQAKLMIIGEGPGQQEDETAIPFVGRAGQLLSKILESANIDRQSETYICNVVKCRPPGNRVPTPDEAAACRPYLEAQIEFIKPKLILLAGATAVQHVLKVKDPISRIRGKWFDFKNGAKVMPVFHPSYLLRNDSREIGSPKWLMWQDIKEVRTALDALND